MSPVVGLAPIPPVRTSYPGISFPLIPMLADKYHVIAPDFPGYGESSAPSVNDSDYSYERLATVTEKFTEKLNLSSYALYLSDIGSSVGFRLAVMHPEPRYIRPVDAWILFEPANHQVSAKVEIFSEV